MQLTDSITSLKGIGTKTAALFNRVGVFSLWDLLMYIPRDFEVFPEPGTVSGMVEGGTYALLLTVKTEPNMIRAGRLNILSVIAADRESRTIVLKWFNSPFMKKLIKPGMTRVFYGKAFAGRTSMELQHPKYFERDEYEKLTGVMQPVYPLTKGLSSKTIGQAVSRVLEETEIRDFLGTKELEELKLMELKEALETLHRPESMENTVKARKRIAFNEFLIFMTDIRAVKKERENAVDGIELMETAGAKRVMESLPFSLTDAQKKAYDDIMADITSGKVMNRLLQGDTGSGKTIVAFLAMITAAENGYQAALMAPTEVLATQHAIKLKKLTEDAGLPIKTVLLTGSMPEKEKREARKEIEEGSAQLVIGTHALIEDKVLFNNLCLAITDEQHRFGVKQRENLSKGKSPHVLVMSATPIPRTLAIILYGDLDISVMDDMPGMRLPIKNCVVGPEYRSTAYKFIRKEADKGHQAYVICPMVEASESMSCENVTDYAERLKSVFGGNLRIGVLNGRMKGREKTDVMERFKNHDIDLLVSTTVIEVGVDVPNATVMMIENAERFGLASLHQIRGRVGRGDAQGYCIFIDTSGKSGENERLKILKNSNDGFKIADEDLSLRGPGDLFGIRQSGDMDFRVADIYNDADMLRLASAFADKADEETLSKLREYRKYGEDKVIL